MNANYPGNPNNPQPQYPQQPYLQQQVYGQQYPIYVQQQPPPKNSNRGLFIGCGIALLVVLLLCGGGIALAATGAMAGLNLAIGAFSNAAAATDAGTQAAAVAATTAQTFCQEVENQQYDMAYTLLSKAKQENFSQEQFTAHAQALDKSDGKVVDCELDQIYLPSVSDDGSSATVPMQIARLAIANPSSGVVSLVFEDGDWKINDADAALEMP